MLQILRNKAQSTFIQIIVVIIALVFVFWGVGANLSGDRQAALTVNDEEISFQEFQRAYDRAYQQLSDQFGGNVPKGLAEAFNIKQQVINQLIQTSLLRQGATEMGIVVSKDDIRRAIEKMVQFQDSTGFSMERYKAVLATNRMAPTKFESSMKHDRLSQLAAQEIGNFASIANDIEVQETFSVINEKISLQYIKISPENFREKVEINDEILTSWFDQNKENYKSEPEIKVKYLLFTDESVGNKIEIDNAKAEQYYTDNSNSYKTAEKRRARHILLKTAETDSLETLQEKSNKAEEILQLARGGSDFSELAKKHSEGPSASNGGDLGFFTRGRMVPEFDQAVFALTEGEISDVVKTQFGYHIILLEKINPASTQPFDEVKKDIVKLLQKKEASALTFQLANDAYEGIIGAGSLANYAQNTPDAGIKESSFFAKSAPLKELKGDMEFINRIFELNKGELSSLIKGSSGYGIFFAEDIKAPEIPSFEEVKEILTNDYRKEEAKKLAKEAAETFLASIAESKDLESSASEEGYAVEETGLVGRNGEPGESDFPTSLLEVGFLLSQSEPLPKEVGQDGGNFYVYKLLNREIPKLPEDSKETETYRANLVNFKQQQLLAAWLRNMEIDAKISKHPSL